MEIAQDAPSREVHGMRSGLSKGKSSTMVVGDPDATGVDRCQRSARRLVQKTPRGQARAGPTVSDGVTDGT